MDHLPAAEFATLALTVALHNPRSPLLAATMILLLATAMLTLAALSMFINAPTRHDHGGNIQQTQRGSTTSISLRTRRVNREVDAPDMQSKQGQGSEQNTSHGTEDKTAGKKQDAKQQLFMTPGIDLLKILGQDNAVSSVSNLAFMAYRWVPCSGGP